jgi:hypothetical protein
MVTNKMYDRNKYEVDKELEDPKKLPKHSK